jgi:hypothetical protein
MKVPCQWMTDGVERMKFIDPQVYAWLVVDN